MQRGSIRESGRNKEVIAMRNIYFSSTLLWQEKLAPIFQMASAYDVDGIEFWAEQADYFCYDSGLIREFMQTTGMKAIVHSKCWNLNYAALSQEIRRASLLAIMHSIDFAEQIDCHEVTIHPPVYTNRKEAGFSQQKFRQAMVYLLDYADRHGVMLSLEIMEKRTREMVTNEEELFWILGNDANQLVYTVDTAHCDSEEEIFSLLEKLPVSKLHISNRQGKKRHTLLMEGSYSFVGLLPKLLAQDIPLVIEGTGYQKDVLQDQLEYVSAVLQQMRLGYWQLYEPQNSLLRGDRDNECLRHG